MTDRIQPHDDYIGHWARSLSVLHTGHWRAARFYELINLILGIAAALSAAVAGTTAFQDLAGQGATANPTAQFWGGAFAVIAAALAAVQTFFRSSELATKHKQAGVKFGQLERELEGYIDLGIPMDAHEREKLLKPFHARWNQVEDEALPLPQRIYDRAAKEYDQSEKPKKRARSQGGTFMQQLPQGS